jgi:hypothetical protein
MIKGNGNTVGSRKVEKLSKRQEDILTEILISPLSLAVWYMDDGYNRKDCKGLYLCTSSYKFSEQKLLQKALFRNFAIKTKIHHAAGNMRLYVSSAYYHRFINIVGKHTLPNFSYKLS